MRWLIHLGAKPALYSLAGALCLTGCGDDKRLNADNSDSTAVELGEESGEADAGSESAGQKLDAIEGQDGGDDAYEDGCDKVDVLFLVDPSPSMRDNVAKLAANAPGFVQAMREQLEGVASYHVGIINSGYIESVYHDEWGLYGPCNEVGALITREIQSGPECGPFADGLRYMTEEDDLETQFPCALIHGDTGTTNERHLMHLQAALSEELGQPGACNEGFLRRKDGLLVIVMITDEDDGGNPMQGSPGEPADWFAPVVAAKGGREENIVVLTLRWQDPRDGVGSCDPSSQGERPAHRLEQFTQMFSNGYLGDVCADNYKPFFDEAVNVVHTACQEFVAQ